MKLSTAQYGTSRAGSGRASVNTLRLVESRMATFSADDVHKLAMDPDLLPACSDYTKRFFVKTRRTLAGQV